ncbi:MAG TPA: GNAT family N-acetyltransferase, partial [Ktedonobacterales bacterium]
YSGGDLTNDWLRAPLEVRGFELVSVLRSYDKVGFAIPSSGNTEVRVRPFTRGDVTSVVVVEHEAFAPLWRHDAASFLDVAAHYPYFVVAEDASGIIGYQFNTLDAGAGYLVRIAVHPRVAGQGVGARLMAEAVRYFASRGVRRILLNTEEQNIRAHALYERFGFVRVPPQGFVLERPIGASR